MAGFEPELKLEHQDSRGQIYSIQLPDNQELMLLHSKAGSLRGGHAHDVDEIVVLLTGKMTYHKLKEIEADGEWLADGEITRDMKPGDCSFNWRGQTHMGEFVEDSWVLEWKIDTRKGAWRNKDYKPWREKVLAQAKAVEVSS